jgi:hypothetical protein
MDEIAVTTEQKELNPGAETPGIKVGENPTEPDISKQLSYVVETKQQKEHKEEQERTRIKKALFVDGWKKYHGVVSVICDKVGIDRCTFYEWRKDDPDFSEAIRTAKQTLNEEVEDLLMGKMFLEKDGTSIRYFLDRKHPGYKPRSVSEVVVGGDRTLEDLIDEDKAKPTETTNAENTTGNDRGDTENKGQEGAVSEVQAEPSAEVLLGAQDAPQHNPEG